MIVDTSKVIIFGAVALVTFAAQYRMDGMSTSNMRLNIENALLVSTLAIILLMLYDNISVVVENIDNMGPELGMVPNGGTPIIPVPMEQTVPAIPGMTSPSADGGPKPPMPSAGSGSPATSAALGSSPSQMMTPPVEPTTTDPMSPPSEAPQAIPSDILSAQQGMLPTGQPSTIPDVAVDRSMNDNSGVMPAEETMPMVPNSAPTNVKVMMEGDGPDDAAIEVDVDVSAGNDMETLQDNVQDELARVESDPKMKYVLSDPKKWVSENMFKMHVLPKCQVCPVVMCDQNFMSV